MAEHRHCFVDSYDGMVAFGFSRDIDEKSLMVYLQKFSDDEMLKTLVPRLSDEEITEVFDLLSRLLRRCLTDNEYHELFLKDADHSHEE